MPAGLTVLGEQVFDYCDSLQSITIPGSVTTVPYRLCGECHNLSTVIMGEGTTSIDEGAFFGCSSLNSVTLPETLTYIGVNAFWECSSLESIDFPEQLETIDRMAFYCAGLTSLTLNEGLKKINEGAFTGIHVKSLTISTSAELGREVFNSGSLEEVTVTGNVKIIPENSFYSSRNLKKVTIEEGVEVIEAKAFQDCVSLSEVVLPSTLRSFSGSAFARWHEEYPKIIIADTNPYFTIIDDVLFNKDLTVLYAYFSSNKEYVIPETVTEIGEGAFYEGNIRKIELPTGLKKIGDNAFQACFLQRISIKGEPFAEINMLPEGLEEIGYAAFENAHGEGDIYIPSSVLNIGILGLHGFPGIQVSEDNPYYASYDGVLYDKSFNTLLDCPTNKNDVVIHEQTKKIGEKAFVETNVYEIVIPNSVEEIDYQAFYSGHMEKVIIGSGVTTIAEDAFNCRTLKEVAFSQCTNNLKTIGECAFRATAIETLRIPDGVETISDSCFIDCSGLRSLYIPASVTYFGASACWNCYNLEKVIFEGDQPFFHNNNTPGITLVVFAFGNVNHFNLFYNSNYTDWLEVEREWTNDGIQNVTFISKSSDDNFWETERYLGKSKHYFSNWITTEEATENEEGVEERCCPFCDETEIRPIPPLEHTHNLIENSAKEPTCEEDGNIAYWYCDGCNKYFSDELAETEIEEESIIIFKSDHSYGSWRTINEATEEKEGIEERTCSVCNETETRTIPKLSHVHNLIVSYAKAPSCEEEGNIQYWHCEKCGKYFSDANGQDEVDAKEIVIPATGHNYSFSEWKWSEDYSTADAEFVCANDSSHKKTVPASVTSDIVPPTCVTTGKSTYTAKAIFEGIEYTDTAEFTTPAISHNYGEWKVTKPATCTEDGTETRTCSYDASHRETQIIPKIGHNYSFSEWRWSEDNSTAEAIFICTNDSSHIETVSAAITSETVYATCETSGKTTYTAKATFEGKEYTDVKEVILPTLGHNYSFSTWKWSEDNSTAEAVFICANDSSHKETVSAIVTSETVAATCETAGKTTYTAKGTFEGKEYTDTKEVTIFALGHDYGEWKVTKLATCTEDGTETRICSHNASHTETRVIPKTGHKYSLSEWKWSDDSSTAEAVFICTNDSSHKETVSATVTSETVPSTCETAGKTTYTAKATFEGKEYTDTKEVAIPALGHTYEFSTWTWNEDYTKATAVFVCSRDASHKTEKDAVITSETTDAKCLEAGKTTYTAKAAFEGKEYTDTKEVTIPATGHDYGEWKVTKPATCTEDGTETRTCSHDASHTETRTIEKTGHSWSEWKTVKEATEDEEGLEERTCSNCSEKETRSIPKLNHVHNLIKTDAKNPSCEENGNIQYWHCDKCGRYFSDSEGKNEINAEDIVVKALGHAYEFGTWTWNEDYTKATAVFVCSRDASHKIEKDATITSETVDAKCEEAGKTTYTAKASFEEKEYTDTKEVTIPALSHDYGEWKVTKPATCTEDGIETRTCSHDASHTETRTVEKTGHNWSEWKTVKEATEKEEGLEERTCSNCSEKETRNIPVKEKPFQFDDVQDPERSFYAPVYWAVEKGITKGTSDTTFSPGNPCTRAQFVTFLWRQQGMPEPSLTTSPFKDVQDKKLSYYKAVLWALEKGITTGTSDTTFSPGKTCTRAQVVTFLWRANNKPKPKTTKNPFSDVKAGLSYSDAVLWAYENKITTGTSATTFAPGNPCTRAQTVTFLYRTYADQ